MTKYEELKFIIDSKVKKELLDNESKIIDSFVCYFGEEYRNIIESRYKELVFCYYIPWDFVLKIIDGSNNIELVNCLSELKNAYLMYDQDEFKDDFSLYKLDIVGSNKKKIFDQYMQDLKIQKVLMATISGESGALLSSLEAKKPLVIFPLFLTASLATHEISHGIVTTILAEYYENDKAVGIVNQTGLSYGSYKTSYFDALEELINEKVNKIVVSNMKKRKVNFSYLIDNKDLVFESVYDKYDILIDEFFYEFEEKIKIARLTSNLNYLINIVGKDNLYRLNFLITQAINGEEVLNVKRYVDEVVYLMKQHAITRKRVK